MNGVIAQIWFESGDREDGRPARYVVCRTSFATFNELVDAIEADELIRSETLWTEKLNTHSSLIREAHPFAFRGAAVSRIALSHREFVEGARGE
ncbi:hypothetical protein [Celeribacter halophilus]|uniref:Uncharacterized protein n=1 Tax=Celeribacter halophilus TaxID=576117 RepID=A0A1I3XI48_9RHOB|nr:hypothetical protein [Celeribacter halophilus]PZX03034.1 hypothetical protein LX82_03811 [Celeribacter halophilus]SFK19182.1 hypothetical protein SAMN04488138_1593 [Celeribacter halophilus]